MEAKVGDKAHERRLVPPLHFAPTSPAPGVMWCCSGEWQAKTTAERKRKAEIKEKEKKQKEDAALKAITARERQQAQIWKHVLGVQEDTSPPAAPGRELSRRPA
jgi:hypothetical protein